MYKAKKRDGNMEAFMGSKCLVGCLAGWLAGIKPNLLGHQSICPCRPPISEMLAAAFAPTVGHSSSQAFPILGDASLQTMGPPNPGRKCMVSG